MISVILCTYNRADYLPRPLGSLRRQTADSWELVVVDDGSTDETSSVLARELAGASFPSRILSVGKNGGHARARNRGVEEARGDWVTFLDSDDAYDPEHLARLEKAAEEAPEVDFWYGMATIYGDPFVADRKDPTRQIHLGDCRIGGTFFFRRAKALALGGFPEVVYADDAAFFAQVEAAGWVMRPYDAHTYQYHRDAADSLTQGPPAEAYPEEPS